MAALYLPTPEAGRIGPVLQPLAPLLRELRATVAPRWAQRLLESVLSTCAIAVAAAIELPNRRFEARHKKILSEDVDALSAFFLREAHGVLEEQVVGGAVSFLYALGDAACT